ncbi:calvin cycle protein CP12-2, chloroplastic-like [Momordica charantia]|uniref:Calvin cycle protein CP12-2, chloroplastic-like n=1 Tax=Momordica charantia TaxID=3673 RepID=A0A6J1DRE1_MOMCH|nr:calvin cycle protein CP12-2, chloroplastic-like [Momordica charantia]
MATISGVNLSSPRILAKAAETPKVQALNGGWLHRPWRQSGRFTAIRLRVPPVHAAPDKISDKVEESIKNAEEACAGDPVSGECAAAWDEVEELSAAASHARDKKKESDPLENYCKDNPETEECRTYDN